jgi:hypothetical protein
MLKGHDYDVHDGGCHGPLLNYSKLRREKRETCQVSYIFRALCIYELVFFRTFFIQWVDAGIVPG